MKAGSPRTGGHNGRVRAAVLGSPIAHSLSPVLHLAAYRALGLADWDYEKHECVEPGLAGFVAGLGPDWAGLSLTMPLKRVALEVADEISPLAAATGAANTLVLTGGRRYADNTDVAGIIATLRGAGFDGGGRAVVLGAGGTAQAALAALRELGVGEIEVLVRSVGRTGELRATADRIGVTPAVSDALLDPERASAALDGRRRGDLDAARGSRRPAARRRAEDGAAGRGLRAVADAVRRRGRGGRGAGVQRAGGAAAAGRRAGRADDRTAGAGRTDARRPRRRGAARG